jgi:hypothetical protein
MFPGFFWRDDLLLSQHDELSLIGLPHLLDMMALGCVESRSQFKFNQCFTWIPRPSLW